MSADQLLQYVIWVIYTVIFVVVSTKALRHPNRVNINSALLFLMPMLIILIGIAALFGLVQPGPIPNAVNATLLLAIPYMLLRLVDDFSDVPGWLVPAATLGLALIAVALFTFPPPRPIWLTLLALGYFVGLQIYDALQLVRESRRSRGVTQRRMAAVALGALLLGLAILFLSLRTVLPLTQTLFEISALMSSVCYFLGFTPPRLLRRAWQEPELRAFLSRAAHLPRLPSMAATVQEIQRGAASAIGAPNALVGRWDERAGTISLTINGERHHLTPTEETAFGQAFINQRPTFIARLHYQNPALETLRQATSATAVLAAPITAGLRRLGVLIVYAPRAPIFAEDDLALVQLLADQAAVVLESREMIETLARIQGHEEASRLKEDFLSAAAHDLKTPLTTLIAQAQLLERRAERAPEAPADLRAIRLLVQESQRLKRLVLELLDATQTNLGQLVGPRAQIDLAALAATTCQRLSTDRHRCALEAGGQVVGMFDTHRIVQLLENLIENATRFSPAGGVVWVRVWTEDNCAHLSVTDTGIGIPADDLPYVFDRFYRAANVDDRRFAGMGLGLYICRGIAEQHGGRIWATSDPGKGSTFHVALPIVQVRDVANVP